VDFPPLNLFRPRRRSLARGILLALVALASSLRLSGFPFIDSLHASPWHFIPALVAFWAMVETARCLGNKWNLYHAGVLILLYSELMILILILFLWVYL